MSEVQLGRYAVFACQCYYPRGGWDDFVGSFDDIEDAAKQAAIEKARGADWTEVVDLLTGQRDADATTKPDGNAA